MSDNSWMMQTGRAGNIDIGLDIEQWLGQKYPWMVKDFWTQAGLIKGSGRTGGAMDPMATYGMTAGATPPLPAQGLPGLMNMVRGQKRQIQAQGPGPGGLMAPLNPFSNPWGLMEV